jgi:hypothetical protein
LQTITPVRWWDKPLEPFTFNSRKKKILQTITPVRWWDNAKSEESRIPCFGFLFPDGEFKFPVHCHRDFPGIGLKSFGYSSWKCRRNARNAKSSLLFPWQTGNGAETG